MWLHLVQELGTAIDRYLLGAPSMVKTELFEPAHIFDLAVAKCLQLSVLAAGATVSLVRLQRLDSLTSFLQNLKSALHPCLLHRLQSRGATH